MTGLTTNTAYYYRFYGSNAAGEAWASATTNFATRGPLAIANVAPTGVTATAAWLNGNLTSDGLGGAEARVYWGLTDMGQSTNGWVGNYSFGVRAPGPLTRNVTGLTANSIYYYRYYATNAQGQVWGDPAMVFVTGASTWSGGAGADDNWSTAANWVGSLAPANPATFGVSFNTNDVGNTNLLDASWTLNAGLTVANTNSTHTMDLGGHTLTLNGGELRVGYDVKGSSATFQNGTLKIGDATAANLTVGYANASSRGTLAINCGFSANLGTVTIGYDGNQNGSIGILDLRNATPLQSTFACGTLSMGMDGGIGGGNGSVYLNDAGGVITALQVQSLLFGNGTLSLNSGAAVTVGAIATPGSMTVGKTRNGGSATLVPTGNFNAYLTTLTVGQAPYQQAVTGTLDLRGSVMQTLQVSGLVTIGQGGTSGPGTGLVYLPAGAAYFDGLTMGIAPSTSGNLLQLKGTTLTIGNGAADTFSIGAAMGSLVLDFSNPATHLKVYGDYQSFGPATNIPTYLADGRLVVTNGWASVDVYYDAPYTVVGRRDLTGAVLIAR